MVSDQKRFEHESLQDRESIVAYLAALGEGVHTGELLFSCNGNSISLEVPALVRLDLEAKQERSRTVLTLRISWKRQGTSKQLRVEPLSIASGAERGSE